MLNASWNHIMPVAWARTMSAGGQNQPFRPPGRKGCRNQNHCTLRVQTGRFSQCEAFRELINAALDTGLSAQRIYQDLITEQKFGGSYDSVKRFVRQLEQARPLPFRRMEREPGQEAQVDFGQGVWVIEEGHRRAPQVHLELLTQGLH